MIVEELAKLANAERAKISAGFFKTGKGQYGEGDKFLGVYVPDVRKIAKKYVNASEKEIEELLKSPIHEHRLCSLLILVHKFQKNCDKESIVKNYLSKTCFINNWDLVDLTANKILGNYLLDKERSILYKLAKSPHLWERRIAIVATFAFIQNNQLADTFRIAETLMNDKQDLIHKACGWMLREAGKHNMQALQEFLDKHRKQMPRTMLRYAIERMSYAARKKYLAH